MQIVTEFHRLESVVDLIARHPIYPGKTRVLQECMRDIETRHKSGRLTDSEKAKLLSVLLGDQQRV
jgi:hypothetical protein